MRTERRRSSFTGRSRTRVTKGSEPVREIGERYIRVALNPAVGGKGTVVPMLGRFDRVVRKGIGGSDREEVADAGVIVDVERLASRRTPDLVHAAAASEVVLPRLA